MKKSAAICLHLAALCIATFGLCEHASADDRIDDPKQWCTDFMAVLSRGVQDDIATMFVHGAGGRMPESAAQQYFAAIAAAVKAAGAHLSTDVIAERKSGSVVDQFWFMLAFQHGISFTRCDMVKVSNNWIIDGIDIQSDAGKVGLP